MSDKIFNLKNGNIICEVPITGATSKIRVKRRENNFGIPISIRSNNISRDDYIEWQISYYLSFDSIWDNFKKTKGFNKLSIFKNEMLISDLETIVKKGHITKKGGFLTAIEEIFKKHEEIIVTKEHKENKKYISYELSDMFCFALNNGIINTKEIVNLLNYNANEEFNIERDFKIIRTQEKRLAFNDFEYFEEQTPLFINRISRNNFIEILIKHKQKAVGYQSMIYFCSFVDSITDSSGAKIIGRKAKEKELVYLPISKEDIIGIAKSFIIASSDHSWDMKSILKELIKY